MAASSANPRIPSAPAYSTYRKDVSAPPDVPGAQVQFTKGKGYYVGYPGEAAPAPQRAPAAAGSSASSMAAPDGPMTPTQIANMIAGYTAGLPQPVGEGALQQRAQGMVDPLVQSISDRIGARAKAGSSAIGGYASKLAESLAPFQQNETNIWTQAQKSEAATDAALSSAQKGDGNALASELAGKLGQINAPQTSVDAYANSQATTGAGAGNALLARGSASLSDLISHGAASADYASKQPGIARSQGLADIRDLNLASGRDLADQTSQVQQQIPGIVAALRSENDQKRTNAANSKLDIFKYLTTRNDFMNATATKSTAALKIAQSNAAAKAKVAEINANVKAKTAAAKDAKPNAALSKSVGYVVDSNGNYIPDKNGQPHLLPGFVIGKDGHIAKASTPKAAKQPQLTAGQVQKYRGTAATIAENAHNGFSVTDPKTSQVTVHPPISYKQALDEMEKEGVPETIARVALAKWYPADVKVKSNGSLGVQAVVPGERG
jgi:hypothetical protein